MYKRIIKIQGWLFLSLLLVNTSTYAQQSKPILITPFTTEQLNGWESKSFQGETRYELVQLDQELVLKAESKASASGLFKEQRIDLHKTPYLNWNWRIENQLNQLDEKSKAGDDYVARIYVVVSGGLTFWRTKAINYVWTSNAKKGQIWPNAFAGKSAMMMAIRSPSDNIKQWYTEKRNILKDLEQLFGEPIRYIDAIAVMTDTDNSKGHAIAYYSKLFFSAD